MDSTAAPTLTVPLIGTEENVDFGYEECIQKRTPVKKGEETDEETNCDRFLTLLLPFLLLAQFGSAYWIEDLSAAKMDWHEVVSSILIFGFTSFLYRRSLLDEKIGAIALHLVPEIVTVAVCGMIYRHWVAQAFITLVVSMLVMALFIIATSVHMLLVGSGDNDDDEDDEEDYEEV